MYSIAWGRTEEHAAALKRGLERLPEGFRAKVCFACEGHGECEQLYTAGCGGGYYRSKGRCDWCAGTGLLQGTAAAPASVREQVLFAAQKEAADGC